MRWVVGVDLVMGLVEVLECSPPARQHGRNRPLQFADPSTRRARGQLDRAAVRMAVNPDGQTADGKERPFRVRSGRALKRPRTYWESRPMDQTMINTASVPTAAQNAKRTSAKPAQGHGQEQSPEEGTRADGTVKTTILLSSGTDELLTSLAYTRNTDRSEVVRFFLEKGLREVDLQAEAEKAQKRFLASVKRAAEYYWC